MSDESRGAVTIAYLHDTEVAHSWHKSLVELIGFDMVHEGRIIRGGYEAEFCHSGGIPEARNDVVKRFLSEPDGAEWLLWVDSDMGFAPDALEQLIAVADPAERPVVGGLCFARKTARPDDMGGWHSAIHPTIYGWSDEKQDFRGWADYPPNALIRCHGTGSAFILIHRRVLIDVMERFGPHWYSEIDLDDGGRIKEDLAFCRRLLELDIPLFVHTGVRTSHLKHIWVQDHDFRAQQVPPPADERVTVIVPVLGRPQNAEPFMRSLRASTGLADVLMAPSPGDEPSIDAWLDADMEVQVSLAVANTFAEKINAAMAEVKTDWIFITGDDVRFYPGWLDHALHVAKMTGAQVVGTNDLGNPRVMAGHHATHLLISTEYIRKVGASWEGPGVVCGPYRHWFVDDEIVMAAKQRGVWAFAAASHVEHLHPLWKKGEVDDTYILGQQHVDEDRKMFEQRCAVFLSGSAA